MKRTYLNNSKLSDNIFDTVNYISFAIFSFLCVYPFIYVLALSLNDASDAEKGGIYFFPRVFSTASYTAIFVSNKIITAYGVTISRVVLTIVLQLIFNSMFAYALTKRHFRIRKFLNWMIIIPMYFGGGLIPYYMILKYLHLLNKFSTYIVPGIFAPFTILLLRTSFKAIPESLIESAGVDGAGDPLILFKIIMPLSKPILAAVALFGGVGVWNDWFTGFTFISNTKLWCAQNILLSLLQSNDPATLKLFEQRFGTSLKRMVTTESLKMAMLIVTVAPILCIYPFLQKYFVKGIMIGSLKE